MFAIGIMIKCFAFKNDAVWVEIAPEATLWATGILFSISVADTTFSQAKLLSKYKKKTTGTGYEVDYVVTLSDSYDPSGHSRYLYLFLFGLGAWIFNIFIGGFLSTKIAESAQRSSVSAEVTAVFGLRFFGLLLLSVVVASSMVFIALRALKEASK
jgi:hypothetical protein